MNEPFIYDSHYQVDKPLAFLDLTISTASPTAHATDDSLAQRLKKSTSKHAVLVNGQLVEWKSNDDQMRYWLGNCHSTELLSRQNSYDYWLMNFIWISAFSNQRMYWGEIENDKQHLARLLLFRWAWIFDAPMLVALSRKMYELGTCEIGAFVSKDKEQHHVEDILVAIFSAVREVTANPRERAAYRSKRDEIARGFKYNTRRHKVCTHVALLADCGLIVEAKNGNRELNPGLRKVVSSFGSLSGVVSESMRLGPFGRGSSLFFDIVEKAFGLKACSMSVLEENAWRNIHPEVSGYWQQTVKWDRKFLGIRALTEMFLVKNLIGGLPIWSFDTWQSFLSRHARHAPEELTVYFNRYGRVDFLKLNQPS